MKFDFSERNSTESSLRTFQWSLGFFGGVAGPRNVAAPNAGLAFEELFTACTADELGCLDHTNQAIWAIGSYTRRLRVAAPV